MSFFDGISNAVSGAIGFGGDILKQHGDALLTNYFNRKASKKEYDRNIALWNMQNEYNLPVNQMQRLRDAGLNPNLVYGNGATTLAASTHAAPRQTVTPYQSESILQYVNAYQNLRQNDATIANMRAQTDLIRQQTRAMKLGNDENEKNGTSNQTPFVNKAAKSLLNDFLDAIDNITSDFSPTLNNLRRTAISDFINKVVDMKDKTVNIVTGTPKKVVNAVGKYAGGVRDDAKSFYHDYRKEFNRTRKKAKKYFTDSVDGFYRKLYNGF